MADGVTMTRLQRDTREWDVLTIKSHDKCDFVSYPANYHACNHPSVEHAGETECNMDICPLKRDALADMINDLTLALSMWIDGYPFDDDHKCKQRDLIYRACVMIGKPNTMEELAKMCGLDEELIELARQHDKELKQ